MVPFIAAFSPEQDESRRKARRDAGRSGSVGATFEDRRFDEKIK